MICSERERGDQIRGGEANFASEIGPWGANLASEYGPGVVRYEKPGRDIPSRY